MSKENEKWLYIDCYYWFTVDVKVFISCLLTTIKKVIYYHSQSYGRMYFLILGPFRSDDSLKHHWDNIHHRVYKCKICMSNLRPHGTLFELQSHFVEQHERRRQELGISRLQTLTSSINEGSYVRTELVYFPGKLDKSYSI